MVNYRNLKINDNVVMKYTDFDGSGEIHGKITDIDEEHAIMTSDGIIYWIDDSTVDMFYNE